jgi:hypothetical protein
MRGIGVGLSATLLASMGMKPADAGIVTAAGIEVVVEEKVTVVVSMFICVVALYVAVTVSWTSVVKRVTLVMLRNWYHVGTTAAPAAPVGMRKYPKREVQRVAVSRLPRLGQGPLGGRRGGVEEA